MKKIKRRSQFACFAAAGGAVWIAWIVPFLSAQATASAGEARASFAQAQADSEAASGYERPVDDGRPNALERAGELECNRCHSTIVEEWSTTTHAMAWVDPHYQKALSKKRRPESCHGCHIPKPLHLGDLSSKPIPRPKSPEEWHFGVSCNSCHLGPGGVILGPGGHGNEAHAVKQGRSFTREGRNDLCSSCHRTTIGPVIGVAKDFELAGKAAKGQSCVGCHMTVEFRSSAVDPERGPSPERVGRSHRINGPLDTEFLSEAFGLSAEHQAGKTILRISNEAGHRVPGLTTRSFEFAAVALDGEGSELGRGELYVDSRSFIPVDGAALIELDGNAAQVQVTADHNAPGVDRPIRFLERKIELP